MDSTVMSALINALVALVLALLVPLLTAGINVLLKKVKLDQNTAVKLAAQSAIAYAEEMAAQQLKAQGEKMLSADKLETAISRLMAKVPGITATEAEAIVHEELPKVALGASSFLQRTADAVKQ